MKNVIVGIDFSKGSLNAMQHAVSIAAKYNAKLTLLFVISPDTKNLVEKGISKSNIVPFVEEKLKKLVTECKMLLPKSAVVEHKIRIGRISKEINAEANEQASKQTKKSKKQDDTLIVLGTHGFGGFEEFFIGNSAFKTISAATCPILTVNEKVEIQRDLTDILIIIDDTFETLQKVPHAISLAKAFQAKVHIMGLYTAKYVNIRRTTDAFVKRAEILLMENNVRFSTEHVEMNNRKIDVVLDYAAKEKINLIIVMKEVELAGDNVFIMAPFSERIVNRSPVPILTLNVDETIYPEFKI